MKKIITAVALTAALTLGAAPAFAAPAAGTPENITGSTGKTTVSVETTVGQISAALPITMTFSLPVEGTAAFDATNVPSTYKIQNKSTYPIKVSGIATTTKNGFVLADASVKQAEPKAGTDTGDIFLQMKPTTGTILTLGPTNNPTDWIIASGSSTTPTESVIALTGDSSKLKKTFTNAAEALSITYTIAASDVAPTV